MEQNTLYTAIGRLDRETNGCGRSCPVIRLGGQTYMVDMQEMVVWTALNWRISKREDISLQCDKLVSSLGDCISRSWDACVNRLLTRGLLVSGCGETEYDALYDLLSSLGIIPASGSMLMRSISFVKLVAGRRVPIQQALKLFQKDRRTDYETRVMRLAQQALLSTAEIIKCVEQDVAYLALTEDQKKQLLHNADIKGRISHYLDLCDTYWECYWDAVSKAAQDILQEDQQASPQK